MAIADPFGPEGDAAEVDRARVRIAALEAENRELHDAVRREIPSLRSSLKVAADVVEYAEAAMLSARAEARAAQQRADEAERSLAQVRRQLEAVRVRTVRLTVSPQPVLDILPTG